ncbi:MAG TPA: 4-(cytidine 5'-diphospho)-2-C-methyl-D-erythritol kinase [Vicinamibacterales bacterium]|nr:4-(cytidine 5'-diphospho)-2-C-methyl-D-erythritol kinase [Vicinamibacterales bacterium]
MRGSLRARAFAKINLELRVLGTRPDGYHELRTTFQSIALADTLTFTKTGGPFRIECDDPAFPTGRTNLIWKAAESVRRLAGTRGRLSDVTVRVEKNIPMQAGLGGGSSNAAAALRAFCRLWGVKASPAMLQAAAAELGADVPYFLCGGTALGLNRGDVLFPLDDIDPSWAVVVVPEFGVSTRQAFAWWDSSPRRNPRASNDLQSVVARHHPVVSRLVRTLNKEGAFLASLSGSGSAVFGLFSRRSDAQAAARTLAGPRTFVTPTLTRRACRLLAAK